GREPAPSGAGVLRNVARGQPARALSAPWRVSGSARVRVQASADCLERLFATFVVTRAPAACGRAPRGLLVAGDRGRQDAGVDRAILVSLCRRLGAVGRPVAVARPRAAAAGVAGEGIVVGLGHLDLFAFDGAFAFLGRRFVARIAPRRPLAAAIGFIHLIEIVVERLLAVVVAVVLAPRALLFLLRAHVGDHTEVVVGELQV